MDMSKKNEPQAPQPEKIISTWQDLEKELGPIEFDWHTWLPIGLLSMIASYSGEGKSALMLRLAGCYTNGWDWPDGTKFTGEQGKVLWCEAESAQALNLDRAKKWGIDLSKVITPLSDPAADISLDNGAHLAAIADKAALEDVKLIIVDSLSGSSNKKESETQIKIVTEFLARLARDTRKPLLLSHHLNKKGINDSDEITLDRVRGSSAIVQFTRVVWAIDIPDRSKRDVARLLMIKNNLARFENPIGFSVFENGIKFVEAPEAPKVETQTDKAADMLLAMLAKGPLKAIEIQERMEAANISWRTVSFAKKRLNIVSLKEKKDGWLWSLPSQELPL